MYRKSSCWYKFIALALVLSLILPGVISCGVEEKPAAMPSTQEPKPQTNGDQFVPEKSTPPPAGAQRVKAYFETAWVHDARDNVFFNGETHGSKEWRSHVTNAGVPIGHLELTLNSDLAFDYLMTERLSRMGPPTYGWSFWDVPADGEASADVGLGPTADRFKFTPGFDVSRSFNNTEFSTPGTQILTITVTPREIKGELFISVRADENDYVTPVITSPADGEHIELSRDGHRLTIEGMPVEIGIPLTLTVNINVMPKIPEVEFTPYIWVGWRETINYGSDSGKSVSWTGNDLGTTTWSVMWDGAWDWKEYHSYAVRWESRSTGLAEATNLVFVGFAEELNHSAPGDIFINGEVTGERIWRISNVMNAADETGAPVTGIGINLNSSVAFDGVDPYPPDKWGPPDYRWSFGDLVERPQQEGWEVDAVVMLKSSSYPFTITPGFDVSRSFDKTVFSAPDTQTVTITVTPQEEWLEKVTIAVIALENDLVNPVIVDYSSSASGEEVNIIPDGHGLYLNHVPVEFNTPLTITATIQVTPKAPMIEYSPRVGIIPERQVMAYTGTTSGSFVSYTMKEVGTWTVSGEGNYVWRWGAPRSVRGTVGLIERTAIIEGGK